MAEKTFNQRLLDALKEMKDPVKDTKGYNYKYATLDQVKAIVRPALQAEGLDYRQQTNIMILNDNPYPVLETYVFSATETQCLDRRPIKFYEDCQKGGSQQTYNCRYALLSVFGLAPEDDDGQATVAKQPKQQKQQTAKAQPPKADQLADAKKKVQDIISRWCELNGMDEDGCWAGIEKRPNYEDTLEFWRSIYKEFNASIQEATTNGN